MPSPATTTRSDMTMRVRRIGPSTERFQHGEHYTRAGYDDSGFIYILEADSWAPAYEFDPVDEETE